MDESHPEYAVVQDYHTERLFLRTDKSKALLRGLRVFIRGKNKKFGSIYTLAKNHGMRAHTKRGKYKDIEGTYVWFTQESQH